MNANIAAVADQLVEAHRSGRQVTLPTVASEREAYAVQDAVAWRLWRAGGDTIRAWKVGAPDAKTTPSASPIAGSKLRASPAVLPAGAFHVIGVEAEIAYRMAKDLPRKAVPYTLDEAVAAVAGVHVAIEVCDSRNAGWKSADAFTKLADNQLNAGLVLGELVAQWRAIDHARQRCILLVDGNAAKDTTGSHALVDPLPLLPWIINHAAQRSGGLKAGDVVTTGSWNGMVFVEPGAQVVVRFPGIGEARVDFPKG
jgi:2-keto-4-pentenoate hydratase